MNSHTPGQPLSLADWDARYAELQSQGVKEPGYGGPLSRHIVLSRDLRLRHLLFDDSAAALRLWNFLLTENDRLTQARAHGDKLVGVMKDLGTVPVIAYSFAGVRAFYPDGTWWTPCLMESTDALLQQAEALGIDASFCPVRAMLAAFENREHFPLPDMLVCSAGSVCDDFSAIAQRLEKLGHHVHWWEIPRRRAPEPDEPFCDLPGGLKAPVEQVSIVAQELERIGELLGGLAAQKLNDAVFQAGIARANKVRKVLSNLRKVVYDAPVSPLPALEMLVAEMLAIHFCSDYTQALEVLSDLLEEAVKRTAAEGFNEAGENPRAEAVRVFWVNPVADLRAMNLLEEWGGRICGTDYMFTHALEPIPTNLPPWEALAQVALSDPMIGSARERAQQIARAARASKAEAVVISRIPGASHCAYEGATIREFVQAEIGLPVAELEIPSLADAMAPTLRSRIEALIEMAHEHRVAGLSSRP
jgi:hypothetical protein